MDVHATKNVSIGIDPYPYNIVHTNLQDAKHLGHAGVVPVAPLQPTATGWSNASLWCREKCHGMMSDVSVIALFQGKKYGKILVLSGEYMCSYVFLSPVSPEPLAKRRIFKPLFFLLNALEKQGSFRTSLCFFQEKNSTIQLQLQVASSSPAPYC